MTLNYLNIFLGDKMMYYEQGCVKSEDIISYFVDEIQEHLEYEDIDTDSVYEYVDQVFRNEFCWKIANKIRENMEQNFFVLNMTLNCFVFYIFIYNNVIETFI